MNWKVSRRMIRRLGLALAVAAFAAPAAQAMPVLADEGAAAAPNVLYAESSQVTDSLGRPLSPAEPIVQPTDSLGRPLAPAEPIVQPTSDVASDSNGFDWTYAGIGAAMGFVLMLLGVGALLVGRHNRRSRLAAA